MIGHMGTTAVDRRGTSPSRAARLQTDEQLVRKIVEDFPFEMQLLVDLGAARILCSPRISAIINGTGRYARDTDRRHGNTNVAIVGLMKWGLTSPRGEKMISRLIDSHAPHGITNEEMWYAISTLVCMPIDWLRRVGWRRLGSREEEAIFRFWREVGVRMQLTDPPKTLSAFDAFRRDYERRHFAPSPQNTLMGDIARREWLGRFPTWLRPPADAFFLSLLDDSMREALSLPKPWAVTRWLVAVTARVRRYAMAASPRLRRSWWAGAWAIDHVDEDAALVDLTGEPSAIDSWPGQMS
jgi:hypothetical protein